LSTVIATTCRRKIALRLHRPRTFRRDRRGGRSKGKRDDMVGSRRVFPGIGRADAQGKRAHRKTDRPKRLVEMQRWREHRGRPLNLQPTAISASTRTTPQSSARVDSADGHRCGDEDAGAVLAAFGSERRGRRNIGKNPAVDFAANMLDECGLARTTPDDSQSQPCTRANMRTKRSAPSPPASLGRAELHARRRAVLVPGPDRFP